MKRLFITGILGGAILSAALAQQPERAAVTLSPEASRQWIDLNYQIQNLQLRQRVIVLEQKVPKDYQLAGADAQGNLVWMAPEPAKAAIVPTPAKKDVKP